MKVTTTADKAMFIFNCLKDPDYPKVLINGEALTDPSIRVNPKFLYSKDKNLKGLEKILKPFYAEHELDPKLLEELENFNTELKEIETKGHKDIEEMTLKVKNAKTEEDISKYTSENEKLKETFVSNAELLEEKYAPVKEQINEQAKEVQELAKKTKFDFELYKMNLDHFPPLSPSNKTDSLIELLSEFGIIYMEDD